MIYYVVSAGEAVATPWVIPSPNGKEELVKSNTEPASFVRTLSHEEAIGLAAEWAPPVSESE